MQKVYANDMKNLLPIILLATPLLVVAQGDPVGACYGDIWKNPAMSPIDSKLNSLEAGAAIKLRASTQKANAKEKKALEYWLDETLKCQKIAADFREKNYPPEAQAILRAFDLETTSIMTRLYAGRITWGEFVESRDKAVSEMKDKGAAFNAKMQAHLEAQAKQDAEDKALAEQRRLDALRADFDRQQRTSAIAEAQRQQEQARLRQEQQANARQRLINDLLILEALKPPPPMPMQKPSFGTTCTTRPGAGGTWNTYCN